MNDSLPKNYIYITCQQLLLNDFIVQTIWWGDVNIPISPEGYARNRKRAVDYLSIRQRVSKFYLSSTFNNYLLKQWRSNLIKLQLFVIDGYAGWDPTYQLKVRIIATRPYHALFIKQMLIRGPISQINANFAKGVDFTIMNSGEFNADPKTENVTSQTSVNVNFKDHELVICYLDLLSRMLSFKQYFF